MTRRSALGGVRATKSVLNAFTLGSTAAVVIGETLHKEVLSGALTANVFKNLLSITGASGELPVLFAQSKDNTSRTIKLRVTVDGVTSPYAFDGQVNAVVASGSGIVAAGNNGGSSAVSRLPPIRWTSSVSVDVASSNTETDKVGLGYAGQTY